MKLTPERKKLVEAKLRKLYKEVLRESHNKLKENWPKGSVAVSSDFKKGDKVKTRENKIETVLKINSNGNIETIENDYSWPPETLKLVSRNGQRV